MLYVIHKSSLGVPAPTPEVGPLVTQPLAGVETEAQVGERSG